MSTTKNFGGKTFSYCTTGSHPLKVSNSLRLLLYPSDPNTRLKREKCENWSTCDSVQEGKVILGLYKATCHHPVLLRIFRAKYFPSVPHWVIHWLCGCRSFRTQMLSALGMGNVTGTNGKTGPNLKKTIGAYLNCSGHRVYPWLYWRVSILPWPCVLLCKLCFVGSW